MGKKAVYIYGFDMPSCFRLRSLCALNKVSLCKIIENNMVDLTVGEIIDGTTPEVTEKEKLNCDPIILFHGFMQAELQKMVKDIRKYPELKEAILAGVTPTSINWKFDYLAEHLMQEKASFKNLQNKN